MNNRCEVETVFERALEEILARVSVSAGRKQVRIAVAYSGGLDSSVLLHLACRHAQSRGTEIHALHVHHGLSPNADEWLKHCCAEAERQGARFDAARIVVGADSIRAHGTEQAARFKRYASLKNLCEKNSIDLLLAAHHEDDQAETLMLQLLRGAGLAGLSGMALLQENHVLLGKKIFLGRPLMGLRRERLEAYAERHSLSYVNDASNQDPAYRRNALRHTLFPLLNQHFPGFASCVARSASHIRSAQDLLDELSASDMDKCGVLGNQKALRIEELKKLSVARCENLLRHWLAVQGMPMPSAAKLEQVRRQLLYAQDDRQPALNFGELAFARVGDCLVLRPALGSPPTEETQLHWQGETEIAVHQWRGSIIFERVADQGIPLQALLANPLAIRARSGREKLKTAANRPTKTLKNLFQEASVPAWQREWLPLFYLENELVFAAALGMDVRHCSSGAGMRLSWRPDWQSTC